MFSYKRKTEIQIDPSLYVVIIMIVLIVALTIVIVKYGPAILSWLR